jgi:type I restriction enzyme S subunit
VPFVHPTSFSSGFFDGRKTEFITREDHQRLASTKFYGPALVFARVGNPSCGVVPSSLGEFNIHGDVIGVQCNSKLDPHFAFAFFGSETGYTELIRYQAGSTRPRSNTDTVASFVVIKPNAHAQKYIGDKVRQAERLREVSAKMKANISSLMLSCFAGLPKPNRTCYSRVSVINTKVNRLEAEYYGNVALWAETEILRSRFETKLLGELATRIKDGPGGWGVSTNDYVESGVPVIRGVNIVDGDCDIRDCVFISEEKHHELRGHRAEKGSVVLSVRGTIGRSAVFDLPGIEEASLNAAVVTIDCTDEIEPHYLAEFFNSEIGQIQTERIANGAVQQNMNLTETQSNRIVLPPMEFQQDIARRRRLRIQAARLAGQLVGAAKLLVEALIERKITEDELIHAQTRLEQGDGAADRAILSRLFEGGWDATETRPLFPDLDAYYETLRMVEGEQTEAAAK